MDRSTLRIVRWDALVETPWKNGGGVAVDIAMSPGTGSDESFDWRINVATIARSGPFSDYPEIDRDFRVLDGGPVELAVAGRPATVLLPGGPEYRFPGDVPTHARLIGEPCRVFNVLTRRGGFTASVRTVDIGEAIAVPNQESVVVGFVVAGSLKVEGGAVPVGLRPFDAFVASRPVSLSGPSGGRVILVELIPAGR